MTYAWLAIGLAVLGFGAYRAGHIWIDAGRRGMEPWSRLARALWGAIIPSSYWWGTRIEALSPEEQVDLLIQGTEALGLDHADSLRCPLCGTEVPHAWTLDAGSQPSVARGPIECPRCDFRLDACRHCAHFLPGSPQGWGQSAWPQSDMTSGRCTIYKTSQPVEEVSAPDMARRLKARGIEQLRAPMRIVDSFLPPDSCRTFRPEPRRLRQGGIGWPDARRVALLRMLAPPPAQQTPRIEEPASDDEQWLL
jgi:hypothetical protein